MNILFLSSNYPYPHVDGHGLRTFNILKILSQQHKVFFIGFSKEPVLPNTDPIKAMCESVVVIKAPGSDGSYQNYLSFVKHLFLKEPFIIGKYKSKEFRSEIYEVLTKHRIDLVHFDILHMTGYVLDVGDICKTLTQHNVESERLLKLIRNSWNPFIKLLYFEYLKIVNYEISICKEFDICSCVCKKDIEKLMGMCPTGKYIEIPNGVDTDLFMPLEVSESDNNLIWVGGMSDIYNAEAVDYFCKSIYPDLESKIPGAKCVFIGSSPTMFLTRLAKSRPNIEILGFIDDIRPLLGRSRALIAPIKSGGGTKLKVLVAMAMGIPVITTSVGAEGIEVENGKNIIIADTSCEFAHRAAELLKNPVMASEIGREARRVILQKYAWNVIALKQLDVYTSLVNERKISSAGSENRGQN